MVENNDEWFEKIAYYMARPELRKKIALAGQKKVLEEHSYHRRIQQIFDILYSK